MTADEARALSLHGSEPSLDSRAVETLLGLAHHAVGKAARAGVRSTRFSLDAGGDAVRDAVLSTLRSERFAVARDGGRGDYVVTW